MTPNSEPGRSLPVEYVDLVEQIKREVRGARVQAARVVNVELIRLYWRIGRLILPSRFCGGLGVERHRTTGR